VAALVVFVATNKKTSDHQATCQRHRDALTVAYTGDPSAAISTGGLSPSDAAAVTKDERSYRQSYAKAASGNCGLMVSGQCMSTDALRADFDGYIMKTIPQLMAAKGC
jgi:hypothetical protein